MTVIIVKDESLLLLNLLIFIKLWELYIAQSDYLWGYDLDGQGFDGLAIGEVFQDDSPW